MGIQSPAERTLTKLDFVRLTRLASLSEPAASGAIQAMLEDCELVASAAVPATVITMYTQVLLQGARAQSRTKSPCAIRMTPSLRKASSPCSLR